MWVRKEDLSAGGGELVDFKVDSLALLEVMGRHPRKIEACEGNCAFKEALEIELILIHT